MWVAIGAILSMCAGVSAGACDAPGAITGFNTSQYLGKWYQQAVSKQFSEVFEAGHPFCVTAEYSVNPAGYVNVDNKGYDSTGGLSEAVGKATQADPNVAALEVSFFGPFTSPYNIVKMLYDANGQYRVALVWSCSLDGAEQALWVLSRTQTIAGSDYTTMIDFATQSGINVDQLQMQRTVQNCTNTVAQPTRQVEVLKTRASECDAAAAITGFNTSEYLGKWYQQAVSKQFSEVFEAGHPFCVTAEYSLNPAGYVNVDNKGYDSTGGLSEAVGKATQADPNVAALEVSFFGPFTSPYNIVKMLYDANGKYRVALVWSCSLGGVEQALWVLSRERTIADSDYTTMVDFAKQSGINVDQLEMQRTVQNCTNAADAVAPRPVAQVARGECDAAPAISGFNTSQYLGKWYQQAVSKQFFDRIEASHPFCVTAEYSLNPAGYVNVDNKGYDSTGGLSEAVGKATQADPNVAALQVSFFGPFAAPYNIIKMLYDANGQYRVALVWSCSLDGAGQALWVLSRERNIADSDYTTMIDFANQSGINVDELQMLKTVQNCTN